MYASGLIELWHLTADLYKPWIEPLKHTDQLPLLLPWIPDDAEVAKEMVDSWVASVKNMQDLFHGRNSNLSHVDTLLFCWWMGHVREQWVK